MSKKDVEEHCSADSVEIMAVGLKFSLYQLSNKVQECLHMAAEIFFFHIPIAIL